MGKGRLVDVISLGQPAAGVDMGRNIFQSDSPVGMIQAVGAVVHGGEKPAKAMQIYEAVKADAAKQASKAAAE